MSDPKRWLESPSTLPPRQAHALRSEAKRVAPPGARDAVWATLAASLPPSPTPTDLTAGTVTSASLGSKLALSLLLMGVVSVAWVVAGGASFESSSKRRGVGIASQRVVTPSAAALAPSAGVQIGSKAVATSPAPSVVQPFQPRARSHAPAERAGAPAQSDPSFGPSRPASEARAIAAARALLRSGDVAGAVAALKQVGRDFPQGGLAQEREALLIEALQRADALTEARQRAQAFLKRYPGSPYARSARNVLER